MAVADFTHFSHISPGFSSKHSIDEVLVKPKKFLSTINHAYFHAFYGIKAYQKTIFNGINTVSSLISWR
jgi:hypothetical protein